MVATFGFVKPAYNNAANNVDITHMAPIVTSELLRCLIQLIFTGHNVDILAEDIHGQVLHQHERVMQSGSIF
jgi:hypothetical protein